MSGRQSYIAKKQLRIVSRGRFIVFITFLMLAMFVIGGFAFNPHAWGIEEPIYEKVLVHQGDTVWGISAEYASGNKSIRAICNEICKLNNIENSIIYPGQTLQVPIYAS
jgi:hypothetical protein